jgi:O-antigen/teichoic acid export membrane protein
MAEWRHRLGELWWYTALMFVVQVAGMGVNFYTGLWLIPRCVSQAELGAILPLTQLAAFLAVPLGMLMTPFGKYLNTFMAKGEAGKAKALLWDVFRLSLVAAVIMTVYTVVVAPFIQVRMRVSGVGIVALLCVMAFLNGIKPVITNSTQALKRFNLMLVGGVIGAPLRLVMVWALAGSFGLVGYLAALCGMELFGLAIGALSIYWLLGPHVTRQSYREHWGEMVAYSTPLVINTALGMLATTVEPFVIRHRLPEIESAAYYVISRFSEICGFVGGTVCMFLFPLVSERFERGQCTRRLLWHANVFNVLIGGLMVGFLVVAGAWVLGLRPQWIAYQGYAEQMWRLGLIQVLNVPIAVFLTHEIACRRFGFLWFSTVERLVVAGLLYGITGWEFFRPYLPSSWWSYVHQVSPCRLGFIVNLSVLSQIFLVLSVLGFVWHHRRKGVVDVVA